MLEILKETDRRLVIRLGRDKSHWTTKCILDKDAGRAWFERRRRFLPQRTLTFPLNEIAAIETRTVRSGKSVIDDIMLTTTAKARLRLTCEHGDAQETAKRMRSFVGLAPAEAPVVSQFEISFTEIASHAA